MSEHFAISKTPHPVVERKLRITRRSLLTGSAKALGAAAPATLLDTDLAHAQGLTGIPHFPPTA